ncbi:hypothetical protein ACIPJ2_05505 [Curtobacterium sp. NPDC090217]|uniref:hypothetical protein n=1 Tax=Curtobacterium sp. NPDC090217 TaxID=3363970 RepID=UPI003801DAB9
MLRSRIAAAAVGATVLGITAALVPTVSNAADPAVATATPVVQWADSAADFTQLSEDADTVSSAGWSYIAISETSGVKGTSIDDVATFGANGIELKQDSLLLLARGLPTAVTPTDLPAVVAAADANIGGAGRVGVLTAKADSPDTIDGSVYSTSGFAGADTTWASASGDEDTAAFAAELTANDEVVVGYTAIIGQQAAARQQQRLQEVAPEIAPSAATSTGSVALAAVVTPTDSGIASFAFGDTTTYFTPQPTAAATVGAASYTVTQATTAGVQVTGSGFAPNEVISFGLSLDGNGGELEGLTLVADADGNVSGTIVLPASFVPGPGTYSLAVVGNSSGQSLFTPLVITADPAPVATPISGRATFTG